MNWIKVLTSSDNLLLCKPCSEKLTFIKKPHCDKCGRPSQKNVCLDCHAWNEYYGGEDPLDYNHSIFLYNDLMQGLIAKWKYRGDYVLGNIFKAQIKKTFTEAFSWINKDETILLPIPLSDERMIERGFNQAEMLASFLPVKSANILLRSYSEKQSKKSREERIKSENPFSLNKKINKTVILVDDIYTTGTTLRHAASLLKRAGCKKVYAYTLVRG